MSREDGIEMVGRHDHVRPSDLDTFLEFVGMTEEKFEASIERLRDPSIWENAGGVWRVKDSVANHVEDPGVDEVRLPLDPDRRPFVRTEPSNYSRDCHLDENEYIIL